ncbi:MAG: hypothetical protein JXB47_19890, partial [Anaerolineae bacterium]|nr:hypothetical protein [Anaerolineae bacterium]
PTHTPFDASAACDAFVVERTPPPYTQQEAGDLLYFVWQPPPPETQVRLVLARAREFNALRADIVEPRGSNGLALPAGSIPFSGVIYWQLLLIHEGQVVCRVDGQFQKAAPAFADIFTTPTAAATSTAGVADAPTAGATPDG